MGEDPHIPPYAPNARHAGLLAARRSAVEQQDRMMQDADRQEQMGRSAIAGAARNRRTAMAVTAIAALAALALLTYSWAAEDMTEQGFVLASWALVGGTTALGVLYLSMGAIRRAAVRKEAGERLLKRAERQRKRAGGSQ
jgi:hypothetical protein